MPQTQNKDGDPVSGRSASLRARLRRGLARIRLRGRDATDGSWQRRRTAGLALVQVALILTVFLQLNYLSCRRHMAWDLTQNQRFTISETTRNYLRSNDTEVRMVMAFLGTSDLYSDVRGLLSEYERIGGDFVSAEFLDLSRSRGRLAELRDRHQVQFARDQVLIIGGGERIKTVYPEDMVRRDASTGRVVEFRGEEVLTAALLAVTEQQQRKIYMVSGGRRVEELVPIAAQLQPLVHAQNARLESLLLEGRGEIPSDADVLLFPGNAVDLTEREAELVRDFWESRRGGLVLFLDPAADTPNLNALLRSNGVAPNGDRVLSVVSIPGMAARRTYEVPVGLMPGDGPTRDLGGMTTRLGGQTQSLDVLWEDELLMAENIRPRPLMVAADGFWGETDFQAEEVSFTPGVDRGPPDPVFTAAAVERGVPGDPGFERGVSRLVVAGNPDLIAPDGNTSKVAADFTLAALNWVMSREEMMGISPRRPTAFTLDISAADFGLLHSLVVLGMPFLALVAGVFVWARRRV